MLDYYKKLLGFPNDNLFFNKYLNDPTLLRLKDVGYFCGMDYASKKIYNFSEYISRYDHSLTVALIIYKLTKDKTMTIAGLYHDIATPCFSHVIDYMNKDYLNQESTEQETSQILTSDDYLKQLLKEDGISLSDIINFKQYSIVDNNRPRLCADRLDAIILNSIGWLKNITKEDIARIIEDLTIIENEFKEQEIGFKNVDVAKKAQWYNDQINLEMHSKEDIYMMELLANIIKYAIDHNYLTVSDLYTAKELDILHKLLFIDDKNLKKQLHLFKTISSSEMPKECNINIKNRNLRPLVKERTITRL